MLFHEIASFFDGDSVAPPDLNHFVCTLGEAESNNLTPTNQYDSVNEFLDYQAEFHGDQLAVAIPEGHPDNHPAHSNTSTEPVAKVARWIVHCFNFRELRLNSLKVARDLDLTGLTREPRFNACTVCGDSKHGKCVGLVGRSDIGFLFMWLALMRMGLSVLIIMPSCNPEAVRHLCEQCKVDIVFFDPHLLQHKAEAEKLDTASNPPFRMREYTRDFIMKSISSRREIPGNQVIPLYRVARSSPAYHHHTSGTTGLPKPIPYSHHAACGVLPILNGRDTLTFTTTPLYTGGIADCFRAWTSLSTFCPAPDVGYELDTNDIIGYCSAIKDEYGSHTHGSSDPGPKAMYFSCVPWVAQMLSQSSEGLAFLRTMNIMGVGGAALPKKDGDLLVSKGINLVSRFGSAECSFLLSSHRHYEEDKDWEFLRVPEGVPYLRFEPLRDGTDRSELVVTSGWPQLAKINRDYGSFATNDLFIPHPSIQNAWKHVGRRDAQITLVTGKKFDPVFIEEAIKRFPLVQDAFVFGNGEMCPGAIIFRSKEAVDMENEAVKDLIWPYIENLNKIGPAHAKLFKDMLIIKANTELLEKTAKGTTRRQRSEQNYRKDIRGAYISKSTPFKGKVTLEVVMKVVRNAIGDSIELQYDSDFRAHHIDSVQATRIRSQLNSAFSTSSDKSFPWNLVYQCGSVNALTEYIKAYKKGSTLDDDENEVQRMNSIVDQFGRSLKDETTKDCDKFDGDLKETIIVTGSTGTLGANIVSLLRSTHTKRKALRIVCFVRAINDEEARKRVEEAVLYHGIYDPNLVSNTIVFECRAVKLNQTELGLSRDVFLDLRRHATTIIHAAWEVNFSIPLKDFTEQFQGLRNLINFSLSGETPKHLVFCSSTASVADAAIDTPMLNHIVETIDRNPLHAGPLGYSKSKWVAEAICSLACQRTRANISILRIGQLAGNTVNGTWNEKEAWPLMLSTGGPECLNSLPALDLPLSWLPVDIAATGVIDIALRKTRSSLLTPPPNPHEAVVFHLLNDSTSVKWEHLLKWIGHENKTKEFGNWLGLAELPSPYGLKNNHPARSLLGFWKVMDQNYKEGFKAKPSFGLARTRQVSPAMNNFHDIDEQLVMKIWKWVRTVAQRWKNEGYGQVKNEKMSQVSSNGDAKGEPMKQERKVKSPQTSEDDEGVSGILRSLHVTDR